MSLIDLTPLAVPFSASQAHRDDQEGNYTGAALNGLGAVLGGRRPLRGSEKEQKI
ncbi:hypothetical protein [Bosea psychrotolerans]|uniref:hypothetical protein n=1 Tax=Bosea psychrotolerans TaxID=1871628 RepID=UPI0015E1ABC9|nr:hypothetical protein [Bosea psychrotolerans]